MQHTRISRGSRVARGAWFAAFATIFAAASHVLVGGNVPVPVALLATAIVVLPICVALAGRERSLWRTSVAVSLSQGLFHWSFGSIGVVRTDSALGASGAAATLPASPHAEHLGAISQFVPVIDASSAGWLMLCAHAVAAALTVTMLRFGETALLRIREALISLGVRVLGRIPAAPFPLPSPGRVSTFGHTPLRPLATARASISHRGPPEWVRYSA